ncbi:MULTISPECIES: hypothetical protein [unclassified Streptomyces]|uniref:hypothetical protein n=1 Tax=unclassified Streptomyces TaxID=2593676 RepID=UPI002E28A76A|nr:hypothetical protein [Streptomyces sp. NBC_00223]
MLTVTASLVEEHLLLKPLAPSDVKCAVSITCFQDGEVASQIRWGVVQRHFQLQFSYLAGQLANFPLFLGAILMHQAGPLRQQKERGRWGHA